MSQRMLCHTSVSYTHLDVYKRQPGDTVVGRYTLHHYTSTAGCKLTKSTLLAKLKLTKTIEGGDRYPASEGRNGYSESRQLPSCIVDVLYRKVIREDGKQPAHQVS